MKLIYTSDLHGDQYLYDELKMIITREENTNALLLGGDLFAHTRKVSDQLRFVDSYLSKFVRDINLDILFIPGNNDWPATITQMEQLGSRFILLQLQPRTYPYRNIKISGYAMVPPTPFRRKDYEARDLELDVVQPQEDAYISSLNGSISPIVKDYFIHKNSMEKDLEKMDPLSKIWICHSPPHGGKLDLGWGHHHLGSVALYNRIRVLQPKLCLHGHIHEAPLLSGSWIEKIGQSYCINPGRNNQQLHAVIIKLDEEQQLQSLRHTVFGKYELPK
ncbi:MAG: metallophosphoesterase [Marinifilaceae bacterium]